MIRLRRLIPSAPEIKTILAHLVFPPPIVRVFVFSWSLRRRIHQAYAAAAHYRARRATQLQLWYRTIGNPGRRLSYREVFAQGAALVGVAVTAASPQFRDEVIYEVFENTARRRLR